MQIVVNGDSLEVDAGLGLLTLLERMGKSVDHVAVEYNGEIVEPEKLAELTLHADDRLEIVHFVGGG